MSIAVGLCVSGLIGLILGADLISRGGTALAARLGVPPIVIGGTVVAIGTSTPELAIAFEAAARGGGALALGNIAGANIINILLVLGLCALLRPLILHLRALALVLPTAVTAAFVVIALASDGRLTRPEGAALLAAALAYTGGVVWFALRDGRARNGRLNRELKVPEGEGAHRCRTLTGSLALLVIGIVVILAAADWFVSGAVRIARLWGVTDAFIGVTVVALGTTAPELATTIISTIRKQRDIGLGNLLGSYVYNILLILGVAICASGPQGIAVSRELLWLDLPVMALSLLLCIPIFFTGRRVSRLEGAILVTAYAVFFGYVISVRTTYG